VELWELAADELLSAGDVGLVPWVPLTQFPGPPGPILEQCRRRIDKQALPAERDNLLAVSQVLAQLRYNDPKLLALLGGKRVMIESPLIKEIVAESKQEAMQEAILQFLQARFDSVPEDVAKRVRGVRAEKKLNALIKHAARCPDLEAFRQRLLS
jgi:hypothetical protein